MAKNDVSTPEEVVRGRVRISWREDTEGLLDGTYDPEDGEDTEVLRFDTDVNVAPDGEEPEWEAIQDGSYGTLFPAAATPGQRQAALELIMDEAYPLFRFDPKLEDPAFYQGSPDRVLEMFSYIEPHWLLDGIPAGMKGAYRDY